MSRFGPLVALIPLAACGGHQAPATGQAQAQVNRLEPQEGSAPSPSNGEGARSVPAPTGQETAERHTPAETPAPPRFEDLLVEGYEPAVVSWPAEPRPVEPLVVATHGAGGGPEWQCRAWRSFIGERGVVLCPAGRRMGGAYEGYYYPNHHVLERIVLAALAALKARHGERVDTRDSVYSGYSQGATMGSHMIVDHAETFTRLVLIEGGFSEWNVSRGIMFKKHGGQRVLFACGTRRCQRAAARSAEWLSQAGLRTRVVTDPTAGHTYGGAVGGLVNEAFGWVVQGDNRWGPVTPPPD